MNGKNRRYVVAVSCLIILTVSFWKYQEISRPIKLTRSTKSTSSILNSPIASQNPNFKNQLPGGPYEPNDPRWVKWNEAEARDRLFEWKTPISFFGKVIDEKGMAVEGANAKILGTNISVKGNFEYSRISDKYGNFSLTGANGKRISVTVSKAGYYSFSKEMNLQFEYAAFFEPSYHEPNSEKPVVFHLRKKGLGESLIQWSEFKKLSSEGQFSYINLVTGKHENTQAPDNDIRVSVWKSPTVENKQYDWFVKLETLEENDGILESPDEFMFTAPEDGYNSVFFYEQKASNSDWKNSMEKNFYIKSRKGQVYSRAKIEIVPKWQDGSLIKTTFYINPSGSHNLESNPSKLLKP